MISTTSIGGTTIQARHDGFLDWLKKVTEQRGEREREILHVACELVKNTAEKEDCVQQICHTVDILVDLGMDCDTLTAAMLTPLADHHGLPLAEVEQRFGARVARLMDSVSKLASMDELGQPHPRIDGDARDQSEKLRKMLLAMVEDVRAVLIKLAERLYQLRMLRHEPDLERRARLARHTLNIYAPLANRLGIWQVKWEMEDLSLRYMEPETYGEIARRLELKRVDREDFISEVIQSVRDMLTQEGIRAEVTGRPKHIYSIWRKMQRKRVDFNQVFDVHAIRVIVENQRDCYTVLGLIHNQWTPIPGEFDDYIANPKGNGYKSLHTAVIGPGDRIFEAQIRTADMHNHAELGVASHWRYKEGVDHDEPFERKLAWLRQLLDWKDEGKEDNELLQQLDSEAFDQRVYVLTPQGQVVDLPQGATPLDFAYYIHTDLGHRCKGAKINNRIVTLSHALRTGERVEILLANRERVNQDWLNPNRGYLNTSRARAKVRSWLKQQNTSHHLADGRAAVEREIKRLNAHNLGHDQLAEQMKYANAEALYIALGRGDANTAQLANAVCRWLLPSQLPKRAAEKTVSRVAEDDRKRYSLEELKGMETHQAKCCAPQPGDALMAYVSKDRGIVIHRRDCENVLRWLEEGSEKLIELETTVSESAEDLPCLALSIELQAYDRQGLVRDIAQVLMEHQINITDLDTHTGVDKIARMIIGVEVSRMDQLNDALEKIENLRNVIEARRYVADAAA